MGVCIACDDILHIWRVLDASTHAPSSAAVLPGCEENPRAVAGAAQVCRNTCRLGRVCLGGQEPTTGERPSSFPDTGGTSTPDSRNACLTSGLRGGQREPGLRVTVEVQAVLKPCLQQGVQGNADETHAVAPHSVEDVQLNKGVLA